MGLLVRGSEVMELGADLVSSKRNLEGQMVQMVVDLQKEWT